MRTFRVLHIELNTQLSTEDAIKELEELFANDHFFEVSTLKTSEGLIIDFPFDIEGFKDTRL